MIIKTTSVVHNYWCKLGLVASSVLMGAYHCWVGKTNDIIKISTLLKVFGKPKIKTRFIFRLYYSIIF